MKGPVELWKKHPDIDGVEVSSSGRVRSAKGNYYTIYPNDDGYLLLSIKVDGKWTTKRVNRLVAETFIPNPNSLPQANHKDNDRTNNNASNLEWVTISYNQMYREKFGESQGNPVFAINLSTLEVSKFPSRCEASRVLGVNQGNISNVISGRYKQANGYWFMNADEQVSDAIKKRKDIPLDCVKEAYNTIKDRDGKIIDGVFVKKSDLEGENE